MCRAEEEVISPPSSEDDEQDDEPEIPEEKKKPQNDVKDTSKDAKVGYYYGFYYILTFVTLRWPSHGFGDLSKIIARLLCWHHSPGHTQCLQASKVK